MSEFEDPRGLRVAALRYNAEEERAPIVVAAGSGYVAHKIIEIADECGISIYHDDNAATLLSKLELGTATPPDLYQMVVDIYLAVLAAAKQSRDIIPADMKRDIPSPE